MLRRFLFLLIVSLLLLTALPLTVDAAATDASPTATVVRSGSTENCTWSLDSDGVLTINGEGGLDLPKYFFYQEDFSDSLKKVVIGEGIRTIGEYIFYGCHEIKEVVFPSTLNYIYSCAFHSCRGLTTVTFPEHLDMIYEGAFFGCTNLRSVYFNKELRYIDYHAFLNTSVTSVNIPKSVREVRDHALGFTQDRVNGEVVYSPIENFSVTGYRQSTAKTYAEKNGFRFVAIIERVNVTVSVPVAGSHPDYRLSKDTEECGFLNDNSWLAKLLCPHGAGVEYTDKEAEKVMEPTDAFVKGKTYTATVYLTANSANGYLFGVDDQSPFVRINGQQATILPTSTLTIARYDFVAKDASNAIFIGDVNRDTEVNNRDAVILDRYIAGWTDYDKQIKNWNAADLDRNNSVTNRDAVLLDRYIANWAGYENYIVAV